MDSKETMLECFRDMLRMQDDRWPKKVDPNRCKRTRQAKKIMEQCCVRSNRGAQIDEALNKEAWQRITGRGQKAVIS